MGTVVYISQVRPEDENKRYIDGGKATMMRFFLSFGVMNFR